jgi:hypothetical protein
MTSAPPGNHSPGGTNREVHSVNNIPRHANGETHNFMAVPYFQHPA